MADEQNSVLADVPDLIQLFDDRFSLCGAILFQPPASNLHLGHYVTVTKAGQSWTLFDDLKAKPCTMNANKNVIVASLLFVKIE